LITVNKTPNNPIKIVSFKIPFICSPVFAIPAITQISVEITPKTYKAEIIIPFRVLIKPYFLVI
jgi:hypothetical protein